MDLKINSDITKLSGPLDRVAIVHDISGFGKCSTTVALPILSAAGIEGCCVPTAVLSTHTGGFSGFTYRDLTDDLVAFTDHWATLDLHFKAIYTGFLGSPRQTDLIIRFIEKLADTETLVCVDPAMADNGVLYSVFDDSMVDAMASLCRRADVLIPNMTEAALLLGEKYTEGPYTKEMVERYLKRLSELGPKKVVLTGVFFEEAYLGAASYDATSGCIHYTLEERIPGQFHGTGDVFASFLVSGLVKGFSLEDSVDLAVRLTQNCICRTVARGTDPREGVDFEGVLPVMMQALHLV
ncbi:MULTISPECIES: pyridoxamine kinase [Eubacterium]|uniref:pyridoxal kinase n=1 Tax=Eubacterium barkeri TaxID=1528 RepID=A0A1H3BZM5_EUBBA|nr:pyridoxamine kinase [Eubacterium barkeri]SDX47392.1 pyridoxine kinase [Eubacterium barkeri]